MHRDGVIKCGHAQKMPNMLNNVGAHDIADGDFRLASLKARPMRMSAESSRKGVADGQEW